MIDNSIDDVMDPLFVDRFVAQMARSLFHVPPLVATSTRST